MHRTLFLPHSRIGSICSRRVRHPRHSARFHMSALATLLCASKNLNSRRVALDVVARGSTLRRSDLWQNKALVHECPACCALSPDQSRIQPDFIHLSIAPDLPPPLLPSLPPVTLVDLVEMVGRNGHHLGLGSLLDVVPLPGDCQRYSFRRDYRSAALARLSPKSLHGARRTAQRLGGSRTHGLGVRVACPHHVVSLGETSHVPAGTTTRDADNDLRRSVHARRAGQNLRRWGTPRSRSASAS